MIDRTVSGEESIALGAFRNERVSYTDAIRGYYRVSASINHRMQVLRRGHVGKSVALMFLLCHHMEQLLEDLFAEDETECGCSIDRRYCGRIMYIV